MQVLEIQYDVEQKEQKLESQAAALKFRNRTIAFLFILAAVITVFGGFVAKLYLKNKKQNEQLVKQNKQIQMLMRELHHRVKNNLQVVSSLMGLQSFETQDETARTAFEESKGRLRAMSLIHQKLYRVEDVSEINVGEYFKELSSDILDIYDQGKPIKINLNVPSESWDIDRVLPLGLLLNEMLTNTMKYAFSSDQTEDYLISINLFQKDDLVYFKYSDNGRGLSEELDIDKSNSFGMKLIKILTKQLKSELKITGNNGLTYELNFPIER